MKKILTIAAFAALSISALYAQPKTEAAARQAVASAEADALNPKKNTKVATWLKVAKAYSDAYGFAQGMGWLGSSKQELSLVMNEKPSAVEDVMVQGQAFTKEVYPTRDYYFNANGVLAMIDVTAPLYEDPLAKELEAYAKAAEVDEKATKLKEIVAGIESVAQRYTDDAYTDYSLGRFSKGSVNFEKAAAAKAVAPVSALDSTSIYNAAFLANLAGELERAKALFEKCLEIGYYYEGGEVYAKLGEITEKLGQKEASLNYLEEGFKKFPQSQSILVGLINYYISSGENSAHLFELLDEAKKNEPDNASLYYVEGNIHAQLEEWDAAKASYDKCAEINPQYEFGYIGAGIMYYNKALKLQEKANDELDYKKWAAIDKEFAEALRSCVEPFEKAFDMTADPEIKVSVAEYLKSACYRFSSEDESYKQKYEKYSEFVNANK